MIEKIFIFDVETTGLEKTDISRGKEIGAEIFQISGIVLINGELTDSINLFMRPSENAIIDDEALKIVDRTKDELMSFPSQESQYKIFRDFLEKYVDKYNPDDKFMIVGHNLVFDYDFVKEWSIRMGDKFLGSLLNYKKQFDTLKVLQALRFIGCFRDYEDIKTGEINEWNKERVRGNNLTDACGYFGIELKDAHDSRDDVKATWKLFLELLKYIDFNKENDNKLRLSRK